MAKKKETADDKLLAEAKERFKRAEEYWSDNRKRYVEDVRFAAGDHWPEAIKKKRERQNRPCLVVDKINQYVRQVVNDSRQNRPSVKVRPVDSQSDPDTAEIYQGIIRHIEDRSSADVAYDTAIECTAKGGMGFFRVLTEYAHDGGFDQELCIKRIRNPLTVWLYPDCNEPDASDALWVFVEDRYTKDEFKAAFPKAAATDWEFDSKVYGDWLADDHVRVCEYWRVIEDSEDLYQLADGTIIGEVDYRTAIEEGVTPPAIVNTRSIPKRKVEWYKLTGAEILDRREWMGRYIPIIPVWGNEVDIEGKVTYSGLVRAARDPQMLYNFSRSAFAERVALTPKAPWVAADGQVEDYEDDWKSANEENIAVLKYRPVDVAGHPVAPPQRQPSADIPAGFAQDMQLSEHDIQAALGMYNASLGAPSNEKSGKAIMARQREGDIATFHYQDNLARAIRQLGRILVDLIPKIYDTERVVRILGEDGTVNSAELNPDQPESKRDIGAKSIYNLGVGVYDVTVSAGPSFTTRRQEAVEAMAQMTQANPAMFNIIGDLMVRNMDWPGADDMADRLKIMLPPQIQQAEQQKSEIPPEAQAVIDGMQQQMEAMQQGAQMAIQEREAMLQKMQQALGELQQKAESKDAEAANKAREVEVKEFEAETERIKVIQEGGIHAINDLLREHEAKVKEIAATCQPMQPMEGEEQPDMMAEAHAETMQAVMAIVQAMQQQTAIIAAPKQKTMQITAPSGQVYTGVVQET